MYQRQVDVTEQQNVHRASRVLLFQGIRPHLTSNCPRRKKLFKAGRLNVPRNIMRPPNMIHTILWRAFAHCAPRHWTPPQLCQVQVELSHMSIHVALHPCAAVNTTTRPSLTESLLGFRTHPLEFLLEPHHDLRPQVATADEATTIPVLKRTTPAHAHVDNCHIMKILIQTPRIQNQNTYTADISTQ